MPLITPYCSEAEADVFLAASIIWGAATPSEKQQALFWGRVWLDSNLTCPNLDPAVPSETIKYANALLAEDYLDGTLIDQPGVVSATGIKRKKQKAGSVEQETEYFEGGGATEINHQDNVMMLLQDECPTSTGSGMLKLKRD